jgi:hypothetical protein
MQETPFFNGQEEDQPIDEPQELLEIGGRREGTVLQRGPESRVVRVHQEALA